MLQKYKTTTFALTDLLLAISMQKSHHCNDIISQSNKNLFFQNFFCYLRCISPKCFGRCLLACRLRKTAIYFDVNSRWVEHFEQQQLLLFLGGVIPIFRLYSLILQQLVPFMLKDVIMQIAYSNVSHD